jgi:hypothetical protein
MHMYELLVTVDAHEFVEIQKKELEHFFSLEQGRTYRMVHVCHGIP